MAPSFQKIPILIVDDRPENLLTLEQLLDCPELDIIRADSGAAALEKTLDHEFALILLDVQMPVMDGYETAELLRGNHRTKAIPIIFVTAFTTLLHATTNFTVDMVLAVLLLVGGVVGAQVGTQIGTRLRAEQLRILLAGLVLAVCGKLAFDLLVMPSELYSLGASAGH